MHRRSARSLVVTLPLLFAACSHSSPSDGPPSPPPDPGVAVSVALPPERAGELSSLRLSLEATESLTADSLEAAREVPFAGSLAYDPLAATRLDTIQASSLALADDERAILAERGFVISDHHRFPSFAYGLAAVYAEDLPLYVTADAILDAVHRSYDEALKRIEQNVLIGELGALLGATRARLAAGGAAGFDAEVRADADLYLAVAAGLLSESAATPVAGADASAVASLVAKGRAHEGTAVVSLFGLPRELDFSQFTPRGHYTDSPELERYFQAMMWLGRTELRFLEANPDGTQTFRRRQVEGAYALRDLFEPPSRAAYRRIDDTVSAFVGEHDSMTLPELDALLEDLGVADASALSSIDDATIAKTIVDRGYGQQRIASQLIVNGTASGATLPLNASFLLFGQRFVVDSYVFSNVVYDRAGGGAVKRMMPNPLDVAYAALGNDQAAKLLDGELRAYPYAPDLEGMRLLVDAHDEGYWGDNLYNLWLASLRALSPVAADIGDPSASGLPSVATTEAWGRRLVSTQLGSWAELRHDTLLYAKQSYTSMAGCSFPDAFVDPYPAFFARLVAFADRGRALLAGLDLGSNAWVKTSIDGWFSSLRETAATLQGMAQAERDGAELTAAQLEFINQAVHIQHVCASDYADGWYAKLLLDPGEMTKFDPTIADVHTQPTDEMGNVVGRVLHVGTGSPRLLVATVDRCGTPAAYVGMVLPYFERVTEGFDRLDDVRWSEEVNEKTPDEVPWMKDLVAR